MKLHALVFWLIAGIAIAETPMTALEPVFYPVESTATNPVIPIARDSVIVVKAGGSMGSGVYLGDRLFATAYHVIEDLPGGPILAGENRVDLVASDSGWDVAILRARGDVRVLKPVTIADRDPRPGDVVYGAGYGQSMQSGGPPMIRVWGGAVKTMNGRVDMPGQLNWYSFEQSAIPGDSGGPVFFADGTYIGPLWGRGQGQTTATCNNILRRLFQRIRGVSPARPGGCSPQGGCPPAGLGCPPPVTVPPGPPGEDDMTLDPPLNMDDLIDQIAGDDRFRGPKGDPGEKGEKGDAVEVDLDALVPILLEHLANDPRFRGPKGDPGEIDQDALVTLIDQRIAEIPNYFDVELYTEDGELYDRERVDLGGTLRIQLKLD